MDLLLICWNKMQIMFQSALDGADESLPGPIRGTESTCKRQIVCEIIVRRIYQDADKGEVQ